MAAVIIISGRDFFKRWRQKVNCSEKLPAHAPRVQIAKPQQRV